MIYDGVITKPELNEDLLMHYGIKGMKWRRRKAKKVAKRANERITLRKLAEDSQDGKATTYKKTSIFSDRTNGGEKRDKKGFAKEAYDIRARYKKETGKDWNPTAAGALAAEQAKLKKKKK